MNKKLTLVEKLRLVFSAEESQDIEFIEVKTEDGTSLKVSKLEEGEVVSIVTGEGEDVKEEVSGVAEYTLEDGTKISVDAEGKITKVEVAEEVKEEEAPVEMEKVEEKLEMSAILEAVKEASMEDNKVLFEAVENMAKIVLDQEARIEAFAKAPAKDAKKVDKIDGRKTPKAKSAIELIGEFRSAQKNS